MTRAFVHHEPVFIKAPCRVDYRRTTLGLEPIRVTTLAAVPLQALPNWSKRVKVYGQSGRPRKAVRL